MPPRPATHHHRGSDTAAPAVNASQANTLVTPINPATEAHAPALVIPLQVGNGIALWGKRDAHPAAPIMAASRHTSDAVQAERKEKEDAKASRIAAQDKAIMRMAELEDQMRAEDLNREKSANYPPFNVQKKKSWKKGKLDFYHFKLKLTSAIAATKTILEPQSAMNETQSEFSTFRVLFIPHTL